MSERVYSYAIKLNNEMGTIDIYDSQLSISTKSIDKTISYDTVHSMYISEINGRDFEIELDTREIIHLIVIENDVRPFKEAYAYMDMRIRNLRQKDNTTSNDNVSPVLLNINVPVTENKNMLHTLAQQTILKQDVSQLETINVSEDSTFTVYEDHICIDNHIFTQNIPYSMIGTVLMKENNSIFEKIDQNSIMTTVEILLRNNSNILLSFKQHEKNSAFQVYNLMLPRVQNLTYNSPENMNSQYAPNNNSYTRQNSNYNANNPQYPNNYHPPTGQKSVLIAIILHVIIAGLGYAYVDKWDKFIIVFISIIICGFLWFLLLPLLGIIVIWVYALIDTIRLVEKYNNGEKI